MDGYAAIVDRQTEEYTLVDVGEKCWVSVSGEDEVLVIGYATAEPVATIAVGDHPQRVREGVVATDVLNGWT